DAAGEKSLYLRPFMIATDRFLGVRPAEHVTFMVIASPAGAYFKRGPMPVTLWLTTDYTAVGQIFCTVSCMTSASRLTFAFSRDGAIPGSKRWSALTASRVPANAVTLVAVCAAILTLPALIKVDVNGTPVPLAF